MKRLRILPPVTWASARLRAFAKDVLFAAPHAAHVRQQIASIFSQRLRLIATVWCLLSAAWLPLDLVALGERQWPLFLGVRVASVIGFGAIAQLAHTHDPIVARWRMAFFFLVQAFCAVPAIELLPAQGADWPRLAYYTAYHDLPFVLTVAIGLFPLFLIDAVLAAGGMFLVALAISIVQHGASGLIIDPATFWLLGLVGLLSAASAAAQMKAILQQIERAGQDPLTGALPRRVGEELLSIEVEVALRCKGPLTLIFLDLDRFKLVNDGYGHDVGDQLLRTVAQHLRDALRRQDSLVRWGGEEFVIVLPMTGLDGARQLLARLGETGLGNRPDGTQQTASFGVADLTEVEADDDAPWLKLVAIADRRMYEAKKAGRNCIATREGNSSFQALRLAA